MKYTDRMYKPEELEKRQKIMRDELIEVIRICKKHNIPLSLDSGTMLGAVRHGGFIPWDDDIDLGVLREDYDRLLTVLSQELDERFDFDNWNKNKDFPASNTCVFAKGTRSTPIEMKGCKYRYGIGLGIFPYDNLSENKKIAKKQYTMCFILAKLNWLKLMPFPYIPYKGMLRVIVHSVCAVAHILLKPVPRRWIIRAYDKYAMLCKQKSEKIFVASENVYATRKGFENMAETSFEEVKANMVGDWDEWLTNYYGDYMQLPPPEKRKNHFPCELSFGDYEFDDYKMKHLR